MEQKNPEKFISLLSLGDNDISAATSAARNPIAHYDPLGKEKQVHGDLNKLRSRLAGHDISVHTPQVGFYIVNFFLLFLNKIQKDSILVTAICMFSIVKERCNDFELYNMYLYIYFVCKSVNII